MNKALAVARWEYVEKIKSKAFLVSLILLPALMIGFGVVPTFFASRPDTETKVIGARITGTPWRPARPSIEPMAVSSWPNSSWSSREISRSVDSRVSISVRASSRLSSDSEASWPKTRWLVRMRNALVATIAASDMATSE